MIKIKREHFTYMGTTMEYELEDGTMLHSNDWNGEIYTIKKDGREISYRPIIEGIGEADEDGEYSQYGIIGFEKL